MDPDKFRQSRQAISQMYDDINVLIDDKNLEASTQGYEIMFSKLEKLTPQAEGEIQERSVKNLSLKLDALSTNIAKIKPIKKTRASASSEPINWDEKQVGQLSSLFLKKITENMAQDTKATLYFSATGKGIRPSYQIKFSNDKIKAFSGSSHNPLKKLMPSDDNAISQGFSYDTIQSILQKK